MTLGEVQPVTPTPAATVLLVRPTSEPLGWKVFFVKRHAKSGFMANAHVFPGGRVEVQDFEAASSNRVVGVDTKALRAAMDGIESSADALAHILAAVRETFEEAGFLLATTEAGEPLCYRTSEEAARYQRWRDRLNDGEPCFREMLETENLCVNAQSLLYFSHWITPTVEKRRFDARFFLAIAPHGQEGRHDGLETTASVWLRPEDALEAHGQGEFWLAPPQWCILSELAVHRTLESLEVWARSKRSVDVIMPHMTSEEHTLVLALPGDPLYPLVSEVGGEQNRIVLREGRWCKVSG